MFFSAYFSFACRYLKILFKALKKIPCEKRRTWYRGYLSNLQSITSDVTDVFISSNFLHVSKWLGDMNLPKSGTIPVQV
jgi:hypothetical protein